MAITATYVSSTQFTVVTDLTTSFVADRKVRADCGVDGFKFCTVESSSYSNPDTTVTVSGDALTSNLASVLYGIVDSSTSGSMPRHTHAYEDISGTPTLGDSAALDVGTTTGTVAAGDHTNPVMIPVTFADGDKPAAGKKYRIPIPIAFTLPSSLTGSVGTASAASTGTAVIALAKSGAASFGSVTYDASATPTFAAASPVSFAAGDTLDVTYPNPQDATLAGPTFTLLGTR